MEHTPGAPFSGIGRYTRELQRHLPPELPARLTAHVDPPLTKYASFLHHLPVGVQGHRQGAIVHFLEDLGCSQMLWRPLRPAVATSHDLGFLAWPSEARMHRPLDRLIIYLSYLGLKRMDAIIAVSEFSRRMIVSRLGVPAERVFAIHSGINPSLFRPIEQARARFRARFGLPDAEGDRYLLYVGTEIPRKNLPTLLTALRRLPKNVRLLKVGAPGGRRFREATNRAIAELGLGGRVLFLEQVGDEELAHLYSAADAYVCVSFLEGFGHPVLEAMACGTPVVCSTGTSLTELAGGAAIMVAPEDDAGLAAAIESVLGDPARREEMAARGRERAAEFTWERTARAVVSVYERVWNGGK